MICFLSHEEWMCSLVLFFLILLGSVSFCVKLLKRAQKNYLLNMWPDFRRQFSGSSLEAFSAFLICNPCWLAVDVLSRFKYAVPGWKKEIAIFFFTKVALPNYYSFISWSSNDWLVVQTLTNKDTDRHCLSGVSSEMVRLQFGGCLCACFRKDGCLHHHHWPPFLI